MPDRSPPPIDLSDPKLGSALRRVGLGCLGILLAPFLITGLAAVATAAVAISQGNVTDAAVPFVLGVVFTGVPVAGFLGVRAALRRMTATVTALREHPDEPWMADPDWAAGRIESSRRNVATGLWLATIVVNAVAVPTGVTATHQALGGAWAALLLLVFPAAGLLLLVAALRETIRARNFGVTVLELAHVPGVIGKGIAGMVRTSRPLDAPEGIRVRLQCTEVTAAGDGGRSRRQSAVRIAWKDEHLVTEWEPDADGEGIMFPVLFRVPNTVPPSGSHGRRTVRWRLLVDASVPGVDYHASFDVPLFRTEQSGPIAAADTPSADEEGAPRPSAPLEQPPGSRIRVARFGAWTEIAFPPARNPGVALRMTLVAATWTVAVWFALSRGAPVVPVYLFAAFDVALLWMAAGMWMRTSVVRVGHEMLEVRRGWLVPSRGVTYRAGEIREVTAARGARSGGRALHHLYVVDERGRRRRIASNLTNRAEAEWLCRLIADGAGIARPTGP